MAREGTTAVRKFHSKSRHGCVGCKSRRTKCDEARPICGGCAKRQLSCSFTEDGGTSRFSIIQAPVPRQHRRNYQESPRNDQTGDSPSSGASVARTGSTSSAVLSQTDPTFVPAELDPSPPSPTALTPSTHLSDLKLLHHYTINTVPYLASNEESTWIWQDLCPSLSFSHPFLLSATLAISSLHLSLETPISNPSLRTSHSSIALRHHIKSISLFRPNLTTVTASNASALFLTASLIGVFGFAYPKTIPPFSTSSTSDPVVEILEILSLFHGVHQIVHMGKEWLLNGPLKPILNLTDFDPSARLPPEIEKFLIQFHTYNSLSTDSSTLRDQFSVAIGLLHRSFIFVLDDIRDHKAVLAFPILLAPEVKAEMGRGNELALVILMCYSLVLHLMGRSIWLEGLGRGVVFAIAKRLEGVEEWEDVVFWAVREAGKDNLLKREEDTNRGIAKTGEKVGRDVRMA